MKELSLNILDISENSISAKASLVQIVLVETKETLAISIIDDGMGMSEEFLKSVSDPFRTTRSTRKVGMGIPLFKLAAEQTGGSLSISSKSVEQYPEEHGTTITATFNKLHIDFTPLGDIVSTILILVQGNPETDFLFRHTLPDGDPVEMDTREIRAVLGEDVPLNSFEVLEWIKDSLLEQYGSYKPN